MPTTSKRSASDLERIMWFHLRAAKLDTLFLRQYRFHGVRKWTFDLCCPQRHLAVECEGGGWVYGRHNRAAGFAADMEKYNEAALMGYRILRFDRKMIEDGRALQCIEKALA